MTGNIKTWPDFVRQKLLPLINTQEQYDKYVLAQQEAIAKYAPSSYSSKPVVESQDRWIATTEAELVSGGPEQVYFPGVFEFENYEVGGYLGHENGGYDCNGIMGVKLNDEIFFFEVSGYHDSWNGGDLYWNEAKVVPAPTFEVELVPAFYRFKNAGSWDLEALKRLGVVIPELPSV